MAGGELSTKAGPRTALETVRQEILNAFVALPPDSFSGRSAQHSSPAHHLTRSNRPIGQALGRPRAALAAFGWTKTRASCSPEALRDVYRAALAAGGRASGRYVPQLQTQGRAYTSGRVRCSGR